VFFRGFTGKQAESAVYGRSCVRLVDTLKGVLIQEPGDFFRSFYRSDDFPAGIEVGFFDPPRPDQHFQTSEIVVRRGLAFGHRGIGCGIDVLGFASGPFLCHRVLHEAESKAGVQRGDKPGSSIGHGGH
jgi:hypothetical protein